MHGRYHAVYFRRGAATGVPQVGQVGGSPHANLHANHAAKSYQTLIFPPFPARRCLQAERGDSW